MSELPTPALVPSGHVVRVRLGGSCYTSAVMSPSEAKERADQLVRELAKASTGTGFVAFTNYDGTDVQVKARSVSVVEHGAPHPRKERPAPVVNVYAADLGSMNAADVLAFARDAEFLAGS